MNLFDVMTGKLSRMSYVNRYSSFPVNRRENVAEHSWWVAFIGYTIAVDLISQGHAVNIEWVLAGAVMHDVSEVSSGDVIRSYKHTSPEILRAMQDADAENMHRLFDGEEFSPIGPSLQTWWLGAKDKHTLEGQIVSFADMASVAFYCREEDRAGNRAIRPVLKEMYETWFGLYHEHELLGQFIGQMFPNGRFFDMLREVNLPAQKMMEAPRWHDEGPTGEWDHAGLPGKEVPLG